jgi:hypothetical protein
VGLPTTPSKGSLSLSSVQKCDSDEPRGVRRDRLEAVVFTSPEVGKRRVTQAILPGEMLAR